MWFKGYTITDEKLQDYIDDKTIKINVYQKYIMQE